MLLERERERERERESNFLVLHLANNMKKVRPIRVFQTHNFLIASSNVTRIIECNDVGRILGNFPSKSAWIHAHAVTRGEWASG